MASFKEIVTKAVVGKGKKSFKNNYVIDVENTPTTVLGCWVINHKFKGYKSGNETLVDGSFDINIWYSYDNDSKTAVINKKIDYNDLFNVKVREDVDLSGDTDIIVRCLRQPTCSSVKIVDGKISFDIEKELGVEIVGEAKVKISTIDEEDSWDEIVDDDFEESLNSIDEKVDENYLDKRS
ncbi:MAG: outer spore coat protein CotE [Bacilli bacterium]|nr:outer spore coat protein CotE [Bacilli bacterium]